MMKTTFSKISLFANKNAGVLVAQISQQMAMLQIVKSVLPAELAAHAIHCIRQPNKLIIFTDSPTWATKLRFYKDAILNAARKAEKGNDVGFQIKVLNNFTAKTKNKPLLVPSIAVIDEIKALSKRVADQELKNSLAKLSETLSLAKEKK